MTSVGLPHAIIVRPRIRWERAVNLVTAVLVGGFLVSTIPGVRPHPGYNLLLDGYLNNLAYATAPVLCLVRARRSTIMRTSWYVLAAGLALYGAGNVYWTIAIRPLDPEPFPSIADGLWLSFYPFAFVAIVLVLRQHMTRFSLSLWLDGLVGALATAALAAAAIVGPVLAGATGSTAAIVTTTAYPLLDLVLLILVVASLALYRWRPPTGVWLFGSGLALFVIADAVYLVSTAHNTYVSGGLNDGIWVLATIVMALAPGWGERPAGLRLSNWVVLGVPVLATLAALGLLVRGHIHPVATSLAAATVIFAVARLIVTFREATVLAESHQLALTDDLTGLANRRALYVYAKTALENVGADNPASLLLLDLDRFKEVNDSLGHQTGDELLKQVARQLQAAIGPQSALLARLGGDEFAVLLVDAGQLTAERVAIDIRDALSTPIVLDDVSVLMTASVGIAVAPTHGDDITALLRTADMAMYTAKHERIGFSVYTESTDALEGVERLRAIEELRSVIAHRELAVHYQPKIDVATQDLVGVEALVRWQHPTLGLLAPAAFLPIVEDAGLMHELTLAVLEQSLDQVRLWRDSGRDIPVAVNLSPSSLVDSELPERVLEMLWERELPPSLLEIEITEEVIMADRERGRGVLQRLRQLGISVAVDDFGTGYSSLAYLRELPIDELKLDRSFLKAVSHDERAVAIVRATIELAHSLGLRMVAEGVEDAMTAEQLSGSGCDRAQGFFYGHPLPPDELDAWWANRNSVGALIAGPDDLQR